MLCKSENEETSKTSHLELLSLQKLQLMDVHNILSMRYELKVRRKLMTIQMKLATKVYIEWKITHLSMKMAWKVE